MTPQIEHPLSRTADSTRQETPVRKLFDVVARGLGSAPAAENLGWLSQQIQKAASGGDRTRLAFLAKLYWLIAIKLDQNSQARLRDLWQALGNKNISLHALDVMEDDPHAPELLRMLDPVQYPATSNKQWQIELEMPARAYAGSMDYFSEAMEGLQHRTAPIKRVSSALTAEDPEVLRRRDPWMYR